MGGGHSFARVRYVLVMLKNVDHAYGPVSGRPVSIATKMPQDFHPQRLGDKCVGGGGGEWGPSELAELDLEQSHVDLLSNSEHSQHLTLYTHKAITNLHTCMHRESLEAVKT